MATGFAISVLGVLLLAGPAGVFASRRRRVPHAAHRDLLRRTRLHKTLRLETTSADDREYFAAAWERAYDDFPGEPVRALNNAAELVRDPLDTRGYPDGREDKLTALLSVKHPGTLAGYRQALPTLRRAQADPALPTSAEKNSALIYFRALFDDVLDAADTAARQTAQTVSETPPPPLPPSLPDTQARP